MDCLKDYIGLLVAPTQAEGENPPPASGLALVDLPGIYLDKISKAKFPADTTDEKYWTALQTRALKKLATACMSKLNECYKITDPVIVSCLVCEKKVLFGTVLWYLLGAEFMIDLLYSPAVNRWTTIEKPEAEELKNYYQTEYESELANAIRGINPEDSDCIETCLECSGSVRFVEAEL
jgi:hypothetical protein